MHLYDIPLIFALIGMALYTVLAGADFGSGTWQLTAGSGPEANRIRDHAHESVAPVWEANHVWLIFVLVVMWTAYPVAFGSIASTLCVPLLLAGIGIIFRGAAYALRSGTRTEREVRRVDTVFALSSILTPFFLGTVVGAIATGRVPVGNAAGNLFTSWFNAPSIFIGVVATDTVTAFDASAYAGACSDSVGRPSGGHVRIPGRPARALDRRLPHRWVGVPDCGRRRLGARDRCHLPARVRRDRVRRGRPASARGRRGRADR